MPCHRFFHTACLVNLWFDENWNHFDECAICQPLLGGHAHGHEQNQNQNDFQENYDVPNQNEVGDNDYNVPNQNEVAPRDRIRNLFETNEQFRKKAKKIAKQRRLVSKSTSAVKKLSQTKKGEIRNQLLLLKAQLQGHVETKMGEIRESTEYKDFLKATRKYNCLMNKLRRDYACSESCLRNYLNDKPGFRTFTGIRYWRHSRYSILNRPWRYHVPI